MLQIHMQYQQNILHCKYTTSRVNMYICMGKYVCKYIPVIRYDYRYDTIKFFWELCGAINFWGRLHCVSDIIIICIPYNFI